MGTVTSFFYIVTASSVTSFADLNSFTYFFHVSRSLIPGIRSVTWTQRRCDLYWFAVKVTVSCYSQEDLFIFEPHTETYCYIRCGTSSLEIVHFPLCRLKTFKSSCFTRLLYLFPLEIAILVVTRRIYKEFSLNLCCCNIYNYSDDTICISYTFIIFCVIRQFTKLIACFVTELERERKREKIWGKI